MEIEQVFFLRRINFLKTMMHSKYIDKTEYNKLYLSGHDPGGTNLNILSSETESEVKPSLFSAPSLSRLSPQIQADVSLSHLCFYTFTHAYAVSTLYCSDCF